jgi:hypothetical protein
MISTRIKVMDMTAVIHFHGGALEILGQCNIQVLDIKLKQSEVWSIHMSTTCSFHSK